MRIVLISDTHGLHHGIEDFPAGDVLVHAGDFMNSGYDPKDVLSFNRWLGEQPFKHRLVCAGNHDRYFQNSPMKPASFSPMRPILRTLASRSTKSLSGDPHTPLSF